MDEDRQRDRTGKKLVRASQIANIRIGGYAGKAMPKTVRRVVTGHDDKGRSIVVSDGPAPFLHVSPIDPERYSTDIFRTDATPAKIVATPGETTLGPRRQLPTKRGTVIRVNHFPPEDSSINIEDSLRAFSALGNPGASTFAKGGRHPLMHRTETIDYAIVLSGEIVMLLDDSEVVLRSGDILVQCGTNHAWVNRSNSPAVVVFALIEGEFEEDLAAKFSG
jgi:naringenin degradation protein FdeH